MNKVIVRRLAFAAALAGWGLNTACSRPHAAEAAPDVPAVSVAKIVRGDLGQTLTLAAEFRPFQEIEVHAKVAGYVKAINVDVGDRVAAGQLLAVLEIPELQDEMAQDEAGVKRSAEEVNRAQADFERAQSVHEVAHLGSTRLAAVMKQRPNLVAQQDIDEALGRDRTAEAQVATAKAAVAAAQEQLAVSKANQSKTKTLFAYARITAPFAGVITHRYADTGAMIQAGTSSQTQAMPIVRLSQNSLLRLIIQVPESAVSDIHVEAAGRRQGAVAQAHVRRHCRALRRQSQSRHADDGDGSGRAEPDAHARAGDVRVRVDHGGARGVCAHRAGAGHRSHGRQDQRDRGRRRRQARAARRHARDRGARSRRDSIGAA